MAKPVLMIHEWKDEYKQLPLEDYTLTFDDGLYTQFEALEYLKTLDTRKIFFISTQIICPEYTYQSTDFITCKEAHAKAAEFNKQNYMKWSQIKVIQETHNCEIGGHSHTHNNLKGLGIRHLNEYINEDTAMMIQFFEYHNIFITKFCYPYNNDSGIIKTIYRPFGFEMFGNERTDIEELI